MRQILGYRREKEKVLLNISFKFCVCHRQQENEALLGVLRISDNRQNNFMDKGYLILKTTAGIEDKLRSFEGHVQ